MALTVDIDQTVTILNDDGSAVDVVIAAGTYEFGGDPQTDAALEMLWAMFLAHDPARPQVIAEELLPLPGTEAPIDPPVVDVAPSAPEPAPATDTPSEG